ncbi:MAG: ABC transporter ATP-binding protein [Desulfuromonadaceae bacterium]
MPENSAVTIDNVTLAYSDLSVFRSFNWKVSEGSFTAVIGPSGCGKSTLLRAIAGLEAPMVGSIDCRNHVERRQLDIAMAFQSPTLLPWLTVEQNAYLPFKLTGTAIDPTISARFERLLSLVGLDDFRNARPHELSGGMQMRAALIRTFITNSPVVLMDEPFAALDELTREKLGAELENLWREERPTVVFVTHNLSEAVMLADRVCVLSQRPARIINEIDVSLPRPRTYDTRFLPQYEMLLKEVRSCLVNSGAVV